MPRAKGHYSQTARCIRLLDRLRGHRGGLLLAQLGQELGVGERQIRRDLDALDDAGYRCEVFTRAVEDSAHKRSAVRLREAGHVAVPFTSLELYALTAVRSAFDVLKGTPFFEQIERIFEKAYHHVAERHRRTDEEDLSRKIVYVPDAGVKEFEGKSEVVEELLDGIMNRRLVEARYRTQSGRVLEGKFAVYTFVMHKHGLYALGRQLNADEVAEREARRDQVREAAPAQPLPEAGTNVFAVERFESAESIRRSRFDVPPDLDVASYFQDAFGIHVGPERKKEKVVIEFSKARKAYATGRRWHRSQRVEHMPDGSVRLHFELASTREVPSFILKWGPHARAIEPAHIVERVAAELRDAAALYADQS
jgi:predicted DNA-binding transcriptional regulator YafY